LQMDTATSPESELRYSIPDRSDQMNAIHNNVQTFELRAGASDVTSYHDFQNLQIAFENVWTEMFDSQLASLGRQLYEEYVRLKDFHGMDDGTDPAISTIDELKDLMDEIKDFSQVTSANIPSEFHPNTSDSDKGAGGFVEGVIDAVKDGVVPAVAAVDPIAAVLVAIGKALASKSQLTWISFPGPLDDGDTIRCAIEKGVTSATGVTIVLKTDDPGMWWKAIMFTDTSTGVTTEIWTETGQRQSDYMDLPASQMRGGTLEFKKAKKFGVHTGMYIMGHLDDVLKPGTRVTFTWEKDQL
jgi:hypothetical protein